MIYEVNGLYIDFKVWATYEPICFPLSKYILRSLVFAHLTSQLIASRQGTCSGSNYVQLGKMHHIINGFIAERGNQ